MPNFLPDSPISLVVWLMGAAILITAVFKDAKARDAQPGLWVATIAIATLFIPLGIGLLLGLVAYWLIRPKGKLELCPHCGQKHLSWLMDCPHCKGPLTRDCHRCRHVYNYSENRCPQCGAPS